jgi:hypothetical protein
MLDQYNPVEDIPFVKSGAGAIDDVVVSHTGRLDAVLLAGIMPWLPPAPQHRGRADHPFCGS